MTIEERLNEALSKERDHADGTFARLMRLKRALREIEVTDNMVEARNIAREALKATE